MSRGQRLAPKFHRVLLPNTTAYFDPAAIVSALASADATSVITAKLSPNAVALTHADTNSIVTAKLYPNGTALTSADSSSVITSNFSPNATAFVATDVLAKLSPNSAPFVCAYTRAVVYASANSGYLAANKGPNGCPNQ